jgi:hypothetical protein
VSGGLFLAGSRLRLGGLLVGGLILDGLTLARYRRRVGRAVRFRSRRRTRPLDSAARCGVLAAAPV